MSIILGLSRKPYLHNVIAVWNGETISPPLESELALRLHLANRLQGKLTCDNSEPRH